MNLGVESSSPGEEAEIEGVEEVEKGGVGKEEEEDSIMAWYKTSFKFGFSIFDNSRCVVSVSSCCIY